MSNHQVLNIDKATLVDPFLVKPKTNSSFDTYFWLLIGFGVLFASIFLAFLANTVWFVLIGTFYMTLCFWIYKKMIKNNKEIAFIDSYQFPRGIKERISRHYPKLTPDQLFLVMQGLRQFFQLSKSAKVISMPSKVVDVAWHEFILSTQQYVEFCQLAFGRLLHHTPEQEITGPAILEEGIKEAWYLACEWEGIDQKSPSKLPFLFAIDTEMSISDGFHHALENSYATDRNTACGGGFSGCGGC